MNTNAAAKCPRCGNEQVTLLAEHANDNDGFLRTSKYTITRVYRCSCGLAFTVPVWRGVENPGLDDADRAPSN